jgi:urea transport system ATP-binding protein
MVVAQSPQLILLDEPVAGLTDEETTRTADLIKSLKGEHTVVVIEHDMEFIRDLNAPVTVLHQGSVLTEGLLETVKNDPKVIEVYLGQSQD